MHWAKYSAAFSGEDACDESWLDTWQKMAADSVINPGAQGLHICNIWAALW